MSDFYEHRDYNFDDDSGEKRRRKKRSRLSRPDEDAWGQAYNIDDVESDDAALDDFAAGMVGEEASRYRDPDVWADDPNIPDSNVDHDAQTPRDAVRRSRGRQGDVPPELHQESPALRRAQRLLNRYADQGPRTSIRSEQEAERATARPSRGGDLFDRLFDFRFDQIDLTGTIPLVILVLVAVILIVSVACVGAAWLTAAEVRRALNLSYLILAALG